MIDAKTPFNHRRPSVGGRRPFSPITCLLSGLMASLLSMPSQAEELPPPWLDINWGLVAPQMDGSDFAGPMHFAENYGLMGMTARVGEAGFRTGGVFKLKPGEDGLWRADGFIEPPEPARAHSHGRSVTVFDNRVLISDSSYLERPEPLTTGAVHQYQRDPHTGAFQYLGRLPHPAERGWLFGTSIHVDEGWLAVGAIAGNRPPEGNQRKGAVWLYEFNSAIDDWEQSQRLIAPDEDWDIIDNNRFGADVRVHYPWLAVTAPSAAVEDHGDRRGAIYLFRHDTSSEQWEFHQKLWDETPAEEVKQTHWLAFDGKHVAFRTNVSEGHQDWTRLTIFRYNEDEDQWLWNGQLSGPDGPDIDRSAIPSFGSSPLLHEDTLYVGEPNVRIRERGHVGTVWKYQRDPSAEQNWRAVGMLEPSYLFPGAEDNPNAAHGIGAWLGALPEGGLAVAAPYTTLIGSGGGQLLFYQEESHSPLLTWSDQGREPEGPLAKGETVTQRLRIHNAGPGTASTVWVRLSGVTFRMSNGFKLIDGEPECWEERFTSAVACIIRELPADEHRDVAFEMQASQRAGDYTVDMEFLNDQAWDNHEERSATFAFTVEADDNDDDDDSPSDSDSSSSGCSLNGPQPLLWWMVLMAGGGLFCRRYRAMQSLRR